MPYMCNFIGNEASVFSLKIRKELIGLCFISGEDNERNSVP